MSAGETVRGKCPVPGQAPHCLYECSTVVCVCACTNNNAIDCGLLLVKRYGKRPVVMGVEGEIIRSTRYQCILDLIRCRDWHGSDEECILDRDEICEITKFLAAG